MAIDNKLFLGGIFEDTSASPSSVRIRTVDASEIKLDMVGLIIGDPSFSTQNKWGPIINDLSNLQDLSSLIPDESGKASQFSWISASTMCWKGTSPLNLGFEFYLINYRQNLGLEGKLKDLVKLSAVGKDPNATVSQSFKVTVHGGYSADIFKGNEQYFTTTNFISNVKDYNSLNSKIDSMYSGDFARGSVEVQFGNKSKIRNLLVSRVNVTESTIEVSDQNGSNRRPLYYRVSVQFTGVAPLVTTDVDYMFDSIGR